MEIRKSCRAVDCAAFLAGETTSGEPEKEASKRGSVREEKRARAREREKEKAKEARPPRTREKQSILQVLIVINFGLFCDDLLLPVNVFFAFEKFPYFFSAFFPFFLAPQGEGSGIADAGLKSDAFGCVCVFLHFLFVSHTQYNFNTSLSQAFLRCVVLCERAFFNPYYSHLPCICFSLPPACSICFPCDFLCLFSPPSLVSSSHSINLSLRFIHLLLLLFPLYVLSVELLFLARVTTTTTTATTDFCS